MELQRIEKLEKQYFALEQKVERLEKLDFTVRDSAIKIGIAEGLAKTTHHEISQLKLEMIEVRAEMKELRNTSDSNFESVHRKLDMQGELLREQGELLREQGTMLKQLLAKKPE